LREKFRIENLEDCMSQNKQTTRELLGEYIDLEIEGEYSNGTENDVAEVAQQLDAVRNKISRKVDGIDYFMTDLNRREHLIDAEIEALKEEEQRLRVRRRAVESLKRYFNNHLLPMVISELGDENGVYETDTARYKMFETWGPVVVLDESDVPDDFKVVKMTEAIDKKKAREVLKEGNKVPGLHMDKVKRIRRS
tara:strand:+ start:1957 stop:2538 length:582 start_codon:yes stop_codon:yes gene_type:complete